MRSVRRYGPKLSSCGQRKLRSDWADAQADLSLRWAHMLFCLFVFLSFFLSFLDAMYVCSNKAGSFFEVYFFLSFIILSFFLFIKIME